MTSFAVGSLVRARGREWVVLPESEPELLLLRPLGGTENEVTGIYVGKAADGAPFEAVQSATFPLPDPAADLGVEADKPEECWLEKWFSAAQDEGVRALEKLRAGVVGAIEALGSGFLRHKANKALLTALGTGELDKQDYYRQLLRLAYRLIFLFIAEDRDALLNPVPRATEAARARYERFYSSRRLRELAEKRRGGPHGDLWQQLRLVMNKLWDGSPELGLPALGSFLWRRDATRDLNELELANQDLLSALRVLCYVEHGRARYPVNWRNIGADELGSVHESLLELHPDIHKEAAQFKLETAAGHERKTTGSYYTPTSLVDCLLDSALEPVLDEAAKKPDGEKAILELKVCDPACGSGYFLVAAARRIALRLAAVRSGGDEPSPPEVQRALRDVVGKCIYGVDLNPMAVELCKISLWMEAIEPGKPLSFLEGHIREGNALLGATPALMAKGIPDEAFEMIEGDDKEVAKRLKKRNKKARETGQGTLFTGVVQGVPISYFGRITTAVGRVEEDKDEDIAALRNKEGDWEQLTGSEDYTKAMFLADAWCAAFVWPKKKGVLEDGAITEDLWRRMEKDPAVAPAATRREVDRIAGEFSFFHWHLAFPQVFFTGDMDHEAPDDAAGWRGGFNVVLGNPPWERIKLQEQEFFAERSAVIARAPNAAARKKLISELEIAEPGLWRSWKDALRRADGELHQVRAGGRFPLCGRGDINTFAAFAELNRAIMASAGRVGCIVPTGIATDDTTKYFFQDLVNSQSLISLYDFQSGPELFNNIAHGAFRFCLLTFAGSARRRKEPAQFVFLAKRASDLGDPQRRFTLSADDIAILNPNTRTCPVFQSNRDAEITKGIYQRTQVLIREGDPDENPWGIEFLTMFHMALDSGLFHTQRGLLSERWELNGNVFIRDDERQMPLYEAKMIWHFDHRFASLMNDAGAAGGPPRKYKGWYGVLPDDPDEVAIPQSWVERPSVQRRLGHRWSRGWLLGFRDICRSTDQRTAIGCVIPYAAVGHTIALVIGDGLDGPAGAMLSANFASFVFDYCARQKVGGTHLTFGCFKQLPVPAPAVYDAMAPWNKANTNRGWLLLRVLELTYTAWDLKPFAKDCGYDGPPYRWDEQRRFLLRCELDAAFFHLYGIERGDVDYILETFPMVKRKDIEAHGSFRTKLKILDIYDRMQRAIDTGEPYQTLLDPPPADPRVAHPPRPTNEVDGNG